MRAPRKLDAVLVLALLICWLLIMNSGRDLSQPNVEYMPDMAYSVAHETFASNPIFADGKTLQTPPAGTIARGQMPLRFLPTTAEAERAGRELSNPLDSTDAAVRRRGAWAFGVFCQPCHGAGGRGDGPIAQRGFPPPPSLLAQRANDMPDGRIYHIIAFGQANMPGHQAQIVPDDRWSIVGHVRELQTRAAENATTEEADTSGTEGTGS